MKNIHTIPFNIGDFLTATLHMDTLEKGAYIMLLMAHYQAGEIGLPNDDKKLSRIAGVSLKTWMRIRPVLEEKFDTTTDFWKNSKTIEVLRKVLQKNSAQRAKVLKRYNSPSTAVKPRYNRGTTIHNTEYIDRDKSLSPPLPPQGGKSEEKKFVEKPPPEKKSPAPLEIPTCIDPDIWAEWSTYRRQKRQSLTEIGARRQISQLQAWWALGHDPNEIIRASITNGWTGLFEPKGGKNGTKPSIKQQGADLVERIRAGEFSQGSNGDRQRSKGFRPDDQRDGLIQLLPPEA